jgi:hypothetical protein
MCAGCKHIHIEETDVSKTKEIVIKTIKKVRPTPNK